jgi:hypothetical protein
VIGRRALAGVALVGVLAAGCSPTFEHEALLVLEQRCFSSACHGVGPDEPWPDGDGFFVRVDGLGRVADIDAAEAAARARVTTVVAPGLSSLLRVPSDPERGGGPHFGGRLFLAEGDPGRARVEAWIDALAEGTGGEDVVLDERERMFADTVLPALEARCGTLGCHGPRDGAFTVLAPEPDPETGEVAPLDVRAAYGAALRHLDLFGEDATFSRLLRKQGRAGRLTLPHRGAHDRFFFDDQIEAVLAWAEAERNARGLGDRRPRGLVWVEGPTAERAPFAIEPGPEGSDLLYAPWPPRREQAESLLASAGLTGVAEVRDPSVSHDARRVVVALRREGSDVFELREIDLETREARSLTEVAWGSFVDPVYAPDGRVVAVWDGAGELDEHEGTIAPELVAIDAEGRLERLTSTPAPEVAPAFLAVGKNRGQLLFATRRAGARGLEGVLFRFPLCHDAAHHADPEYHAHFGASIAPVTPFSAAELADGRQIALGLPGADAPDDHGGLAILDRSLGPALAPEQAPDSSVRRYEPPWRWLDPEPRWRDPVAVPDGTVIAARRGEDGRDLLVQVELADTGDGPVLEAVTTLVDVPARGARSPAVVVTRLPEDEPHPPAYEPEAARGILDFRDVRVLEALYGRTGPIGARSLRDDLVSVRLVRWLAPRAGGFARGRDATMSVLAELPLAADASLRVSVPADTPILVQLLDGRGMVVGESLDRWYFARGGETVTGGTNVETYPVACAGCHGEWDGRASAEPPSLPDAISSASLTLSSHDGRDPRRPREPAEVPRDGRVHTHEALAPALAASCARSGCHQGEAAPAGLRLDVAAEASFDTLRRFVDPSGRARRSALVERLLGEELEAPGEVSGRCPPEGAPDALRADLVRWIETGAALRAAP